jgi:hypothetical protein
LGLILEMAQFNVLSKQCPVCQAEAVEQIDNHIRFRPPTHRCSKCNAMLKTVATPETLWSVPVFALVIALFVASLQWLQAQDMSGLVRSALMGGLGALAFAVPFNVAMRGIVFRRFEQ